MKRTDGRQLSELRPISFELGYAPHAEGSALVAFGNTKVLCAASIEDSVPRWMNQQDVVGGWITGEYNMLPRSTHTRNRRERKGAKGRTLEIQRLIGRALRASVNLELIGSRTITIDCDVLQADGGTRTASVTGGYVALVAALKPLVASGVIPSEAILTPVAAISAGIIDGVSMLDLCYEEDVKADVDANFVLSSNGKIIEIQGTSEGHPMDKEEFDELFSLSQQGIEKIVQLQSSALESL